MTYKKKLIEASLPLDVINREAAREKSIRHGHPSTLHLWWARRPLAAARAVLWASLVDDPSAHPDEFPTEEAQAEERKRLFGILERLVPWEASNDAAVLAEARAEIHRSCEGDLPKVLDPFGGGGAIPLESARLGLPTFTGDLNPVAVLIQRSMMEIPPLFAGKPPVNEQAKATQSVWEGARGLAADVEAYGKWMQEEARSRIGAYYPDGVLPDGGTSTPIAWIWARTVKSPDPSWPHQVPLVRSWTLSCRSGREETWVRPIVRRESQQIDFEVVHGGEPVEGNVNRNGGECIATGSAIPFEYIRKEAQEGRMGARLMAVVVEGKSGREYLAPDSQLVPDVPAAESPEGKIFDWPGRMNVVRYGMDTWASLFSSRQQLALSTFSDLLVEVRERALADAIAVGLDPSGQRISGGGSGAEAYADAIVTYLSFVVDKCADYWSTICSWHNSKEQIRNTFGKQAIPMTWDFAETNPFSSSTGNWMAMVNWVVKVVAGLPAIGEVETAQRDASARIREVGSAMISTDPPYYDNISYADLSDFFYVWMRRNLADVWPDETATLLTPKAEELIANQYRAGSKSAAFDHFESGVQEVFRAAAESADERFPTTIFYAYKATEATAEGTVATGWETFLSGLLDAGFMVTATWPMRTELANKIGAKANMLASSIVLACRKRPADAPMATRSEFVGALKSGMAPAVRLLQAENIAPVDMAQSAIGPGIAVYSRFARVVEADGSTMSVRTALALINEALSEVLSGEETEFDAETRFALTWFEQFGHNPGPHGDADLLARAKNTSVPAIVEAGIAEGRAGKTRLMERSELDDAWDPVSDARLTLWECTQHLINRLEVSELSAAELMHRLGPDMSERARQLAYLLFGVCDRKKWPKEAAPYNMLVAAWPAISRLASGGPDSFGVEDEDNGGDERLV